jgi:DNA-binding MarR family transcriptional regulator
MKEEYFDSVQALERLHRLFLDVVKAELDHLAIFDINNVQTIVLCNIGTNRGYYLGSNVSYNLRKMVQNEYIIQVPTPHDRRSSHVKLSQKGLDLYKKFDRIFHNHAEGLNNKGGKETLALLGSSLQKLERFWTETSAKERR